MYWYLPKDFRPQKLSHEKKRQVMVSRVGISWVIAQLEHSFHLDLCERPHKNYPPTKPSINFSTVSQIGIYLNKYYIYEKSRRM